MAKKRSHKRDQDLIGENRTLRKMVSSLRKQLERVINSDFSNLKKIDKDHKDHKEDTSENKCPQCKNLLNYIELGKRMVISCKSCGFRKVKINGCS